jgi:hypothetical protein
MVDLRLLSWRIVREWPLHYEEARAELLKNSGKRRKNPETPAFGWMPHFALVILRALFFTSSGA